MVIKMIHTRKPFEDPVNVVKACLGDSYKKEFSALGSLCGLLQVTRPKKLVKIGSVDDIDLVAILKCVQMLQLDCQIFMVDPRKQAYALDSLHVLKGRLRKCQADLGSCQLLFGHTVAVWADAIGPGIDFLLLDAVDTMPEDILGFLASYPYLSANATVALHDAAFNHPNTGLPSNEFYSNICADKFECSPAASLPDLLRGIPSAAQYRISAFQINEQTKQCIKDLFVLLKTPWRHVPSLAHMMEYSKWIETQYAPEYAELFQQVIFDEASPFGVLRYMKESLFPTFRYILLYGKGQHGRSFLEAARLLDIDVAGFVISDWQNPTAGTDEIPVYAYSKIPFCKNDVLILQTADTDEIANVLKDSGWHWLRIPKRLWEGGL